MAKLKSNGEIIAELIAEKAMSDGADADAMTLRRRITYRAMESGFVLRKDDHWSDYGFGNGEQYCPGTWKRAGKTKAHLLNDRSALLAAMNQWADALKAKGWITTVS